MRRKSLEVDRNRILAFIAALALGTLLPAPALAWGQNAHRLIVSKAIETLPPELRPYFKGNRAFLLQHVMDAEQTAGFRSEEHTSELQSHLNLVCRLLLEKKNKQH